MSNINDELKVKAINNLVNEIISNQELTDLPNLEVFIQYKLALRHLAYDWMDSFGFHNTFNPTINYENLFESIIQISTESATSLDHFFHITDDLMYLTELVYEKHADSYMFAMEVLPKIWQSVTDSIQLINTAENYVEKLESRHKFSERKSDD